METETKANADQDQQAVNAVREGDAERYRELVQRHERRVFAVAWSRLGDATLAEEAAQEAFIRGYQRLSLLHDGAKFCAWITAIARRTAVNFGLRHRRELNKRQRWAMEQTTTPAGEPTEFCPPETLRTALAELPAAHRECLAMFYLENRSGAEAAAALGISESALRVRLHRARAALRQRLEDRLAESLQQLRPPRPLGSGVMGVVLSSSSAKVVGGGVVAKVMAYLLSFKFLSSFFWLVGLLPSVLLGWIFLRMEARNYRFAKGFRAQLDRELSDPNLRWIVGWALLMLPISLVLSFWKGALEDRRLYLGVGILSLVSLLVSVRQLAIARNPFQISSAVAQLILAVAILAIGLGWLPISLFLEIVLCSVLVGLLLLGYRSSPKRTDYSLFLRASQDILEIAPVGLPTEAGSELKRSQLLAFARFLGNRWLVADYRWNIGGLKLVLRPVKSTFWNVSWSLSSILWRLSSNVILHYDGSVSARLANRDSRALLALCGTAAPAASGLTEKVAAAVESAWSHFRKGEFAVAELALGG